MNSLGMLLGGFANWQDACATLGGQGKLRSNFEFPVGPERNDGGNVGR